MATNYNIPKLQKASDWYNWIDSIESVAQSYNLWDVIQPDAPFPQPLLRPSLPNENDILENNGQVTELSKIRFQLRLEQYKADQTEFLNKQNGLRQLNTWIRQTVPASQLRLLDVNTSGDQAIYIHTILKGLKDSFCPSTEDRSLEIISKYNNLKKKSETVSLERWIDSWIIIVRELHSLRLVQAFQAINEFLDANQPFDNIGLVGAWKRDLSRHPDTKFEDIANDFRRSYRQITTKASGNASFAAPSWQGRNASPEQDQNKPKTPPQPCLCGKSHYYNNCFYLIAEIRPQGWKEDKDIRNYINARLRDPAVRTRVQRAQERAKEKRARSPSANPANPQKQVHFNSQVETIGTSEAGQETSDGDQEESIAPAPTVGFMTLSKPIHSMNATSGIPYKFRDSWILDTGTDAHICNNRNRFITFYPANDRVLTGDSTTAIKGYGTCVVTAESPSGLPFEIKLYDTAFNPGFHTNLISVKRAEKGAAISLDTGRRLLYSMKTGKPFAKAPCIEDMWVLEHNPLDNGNAAYSTRRYPRLSKQPNERPASLQTWHLRMGHLSKEALLKLPFVATGVKFTGTPEQEEIECEECHLGKSISQISRVPRDRSGIPFQRLHVDLIQEQTGHNSDRWCAHAIDDFTRLHLIYTGFQRNIINDAIPAFISMIKLQFGYDVAILRTDVEQALSDNCQTWITMRGIKNEQSSAYLHEQNGDSERAGRTFMDKGRCMRLKADLPEKLWPLVFSASVYLTNRTPTRALNWLSPMKILQTSMINHQKPFILPNSLFALHHVRAYGCKAYVHREPQRDRSFYPEFGNKTNKLAPRAFIGYLVGYESTAIYQIWDPHHNRIIRTRDVVFDENSFFHPEDPQPVNLFESEYVDIIIPESYQPPITLPIQDTSDLSVLDIPSQRQIHI